MEYYVYFSAPGQREDDPPLCVGPFKEFIQITYNELRIGPDGDFIAYYSDGWWWGHHETNFLPRGIGYTDVVITHGKNTK